MVDRATRYQNAMNQIQGRGKSGQPQPVDIPDNTLDRHVKAVRPVHRISLCPVQFLRRMAHAGSRTYHRSSNR